MTILKYTAFIFGLLLVLLNVNLMRQYENPAPEWILFSVGVRGGDLFYIMQSDGTKLHQVSSRPFNNYSFVVAPDSTQLYITELLEDRNDISRVFLFTNYLEKFRSEDPPWGQIFNFTADGKQVIYGTFHDNFTSANLRLTALNGSTENFLLDTIPTDFTTPDKLWLYIYQAHGDSVSIQRFNLATHETEELTYADGYRDYIVGWSPDNSWIIFARSRKIENSSYIQLWRMHPDGAEASQIIEERYGNTYQLLGWNKNNRWIQILFYARDIRYLCVELYGNTEFYEIELDQYVHPKFTPNGYFFTDINNSSIYHGSCNNQESLQIPSINEQGISFIGQTSDFRWIFYTGFKSGEVGTNERLYRIATDGSAKLELANTSDFGDIQISPDDRWAYYNKWENYVTLTLYRTSITNGKNQKLASVSGTHLNIHQWLQPEDSIFHPKYLALGGGSLILTSFIMSVFLYRKRARIA